MQVDEGRNHEVRELVKNAGLEVTKRRGLQGSVALSSSTRFSRPVTVLKVQSRHRRLQVSSALSKKARSILPVGSILERLGMRFCLFERFGVVFKFSEVWSISKRG
ncbi:hypothetical protein LWI28_026330 [Acer negundo]|uniref:Uncharacterized protein n=1 Tax=Acer negundo TaxID=4023 RepID=A0AAD5IAV0_ACENE|nr:hypothetical protein LWI28_026330 [Acer negundo]